MDDCAKRWNKRSNILCFLLTFVRMIWCGRCRGDQFDNQCGRKFPLHLQSPPTHPPSTDHFPYFDQWHHLSQHSQHFKQDVKRKRGRPRILDSDSDVHGQFPDMDEDQSGKILAYIMKP